MHPPVVDRYRPASGRPDGHGSGPTASGPAGAGRPGPGALACRCDGELRAGSWRPSRRPRAARRPGRCCGPSRRRRCRGTARPTTSRAWPSSPRGWKSARCTYVERSDPPGPPAGSTASSSQARPGSRISARSRSSSPASRSSTRQKSMVSPTKTRSGSRRPRRRPTPPTSRSSRPRTRQASGKEYQPCSPPMPSITRHSASGDAATGAAAAVLVEAAAGPVRVGGQRVARRARHRRRRPAGRHVGVADALQGQLDRAVEADQALPAGRARARRCRAPGRPPRASASRPADGRSSSGTGVTRPTQWLDSVGVSTGTWTMIRRRRPATAA